MRYVLHLFQYRLPEGKISLSGLADWFRSFPGKVISILDKVKYNGVTKGMNSREKSKLGIFNYLNFFQFLTGLLIPVIGFFNAGVSAYTWFIASLPAFISIAVLVLNGYRKHQLALMVYFVLYPLFICLTYINGISLGAELSFILYGILSVFFIKDIGYMVFSISFSMISYFVLSVIWKSYPYQLEKINFATYLVNQGLAIIYIFYGLYLIKTENNNYNSALHQKNLEMRKQSSQLKQQAEDLDQLNSLKNKLFSVISHDLKAPMYALRNLFDNIQSQKMPAREIKELVPEVHKDLNYTVSLMENLLQWSKSQMHANSVIPQALNIRKLIDEVLREVHLQSAAKGMNIENLAEEDVNVYADRNMIGLVLRNLVSNAIKFSPANGRISIGVIQADNSAEILVKDFGKGISPAEMNKIMGNDFYTTNGTAHEQGTGLGLMLCKEFLVKNGTHLRIDSEKDKGSTFSFALPLSD